MIAFSRFIDPLDFFLHRFDVPAHRYDAWGSQNATLLYYTMVRKKLIRIEKKCEGDLVTAITACYGEFCYLSGEVLKRLCDLRAKGRLSGSRSASVF